MRVGLIAPPWVPVPPTAYGGTEEVVDHLARGLAARGHEVLLFTIGDATCPVPRRSVFEHAPTDMNAVLPECHHVEAAYCELGGCDVIHDHTTLGPIWARALGVRTPLVVTVHNPFTDDSRPVFHVISRFADLVAISRSHRRTAVDVPISGVVHHGLDPESFAVGTGGGGYLMFIGRLAPEKGACEAARIARRAGVPLVIAAKARTDDERAYLHDRLAPLLGHGIEYVGEIGPHARETLLGNAIALVNPITWSEPFGLVMIEAFACGTPVIAFPHGAAPEIVADGVTGFLCRDEDEAVARVFEVDGLDRGRCREAVEGYFSSDRMVRQYEAAYERARLHSTPFARAV